MQKKVFRGASKLRRRQLVRTMPTAVLLALALTLAAWVPAPPATSTPLALAATPQAGPARPQAEEMQPATIKLMVIPGAQSYPVWVMESRGITDKYKLKLIITEVASPTAQTVQMQQQDFEVGFGSWITVALLRAQGVPLTNVYPMFGFFTNDIVVRNDSPIRSFGDLKGKRIGTFGGPTAGTTTLFRMVGSRFYGFDPLKDARSQTAAPPLLSGLLERGDLDAILSLDPFVLQLLETGQFRSIGNIGNLWREKAGTNPMLVAVTVNENWARKNADVARRFVRAYKEAMEILKADIDIWTGIAKKAGITTEKGARLLRERTAPGLMTTWNQEIIDQQYKYVADVHKEFPRIEGIPKTIPDGTFTLVYAP